MIRDINIKEIAESDIQKPQFHQDINKHAKQDNRNYISKNNSTEHITINHINNQSIILHKDKFLLKYEKYDNLNQSKIIHVNMQIQENNKNASILKDLKLIHSVNVIDLNHTKLIEDIVNKLIEEKLKIIDLRNKSNFSDVSNDHKSIENNSKLILDNKRLNLKSHDENSYETPSIVSKEDQFDKNPYYMPFSKNNKLLILSKHAKTKELDYEPVSYVDELSPASKEKFDLIKNNLDE